MRSDVTRSPRAQPANEQFDQPGLQMNARFPELKEEKAARLLGTVRQLSRGSGAGLESLEGGLPTADVLKKRMTERLAAADGSSPLVEAVAAKKAEAGHALAGRIVRDEIQVADLSEASVSALEAVIRVTGRPAWFVRKNVPQTEEAASANTADDEFWIVLISQASKDLRRACGRVGCIMKQEDGTRIPVGTGWMVGERTLVTNAHVAGHLARRKPVVPAGDARDGWRLRPDITGLADFAFENGVDRTLPFRIAEVLHVQTSHQPDIAVFRLEDAANGPHPPEPIVLDLAANPPPEANVFTVGHPMADLNDDANVGVVFGKLDGTKRICPGKVVAVLGGEVLAHDCSTTNGSSGSPVLDFGSLKAVGLHYFGKPGARNEAVFLPAIAGHPAIVKSLSGQWGI